MDKSFFRKGGKYMRKKLCMLLTMVMLIGLMIPVQGLAETDQELENVIKMVKEKIEEILKKNDSKIVKEENWGVRSLAYSIKKNYRGKYSNLYIEGNSKVIKELEKFERYEIDSIVDMVYETPNYKIWVGHYINQLEADRKLLEIRKYFSDAFIFRPVMKPIIEQEIKEN